MTGFVFSSQHKSFGYIRESRFDDVENCHITHVKLLLSILCFGMSESLNQKYISKWINNNYKLLYDLTYLIQVYSNVPW